MSRYRSQSWLHPSLYIGPSLIDGQGVFSHVAIQRGEVVAIWGGRIFSRSDIAAGKAKNHTMVAVDEGVFLGCAPSDTYSDDDYMNHSCAPNIGMKDGVTLVARRDIPAGEELTADYAIWLDNPEYIMKRRCNCQTPACRSIVTGLDWRRGTVQRINRGYFSPFLRRRIEALSFSGGQSMDILVTGGSRGIGRAIADELVAAGHRVLIVARNKRRLQDATETLARGASAPPLSLVCDVSKVTDRNRLAAYCRRESFAPQVLVLNAGIYIEGTLIDAKPGAFEETMRVNMEACYHLVRLFSRDLMARKGGRVVLIGSTAAYEAYPVGALYGVSKWALRGFAVNLRHELMSKGVGVTFIAPGGTLTDLWAGEVLPENRLMAPADVGKIVRATLELSPQAVVEEVIFRPMLGDMHE